MYFSMRYDTVLYRLVNTQEISCTGQLELSAFPKSGSVYRSSIALFAFLLSV